MFYPELFCLVFLAVAYSIGDESESDSRIAPVKLNFDCAKKSEEATEKPPIILFHGLGGDKSNWKGTFEALAFLTGRKVCAADLRNHGDSPWNDDAGVAAMTEDAVHLLDILQASKAVIIGHSLGGKIAIHTALNYPERVERIVVEDVPPNNLPPGFVSSLPMMLKLIKNAMDTVPEGSDEAQATKIIMTFMNNIMQQFNMTFEGENPVDLSLTCSGGKCRWKTNIDALLKMIETDTSSFWVPSTGVYDAPALFIYGTESIFNVGGDEENIRKLFPKAKLVPVEGANHMIHSLFPKFLDEVVKFIDSN